VNNDFDLAVSAIPANVFFKNKSEK